MQWIREYEPDPQRSRLFRRALFITLVGNLFLAVGKGMVAHLSGSVALYADAANSASDVFYSLMLVLGLWMAQQPPDMSHPQGHSRFEPLAGLMIAAAMTFAGYEAGRAAIVRFLSGGQAVAPGLPTIALLASAAIKAGMFVLIRRIARSVHSPTLETTARDNLADVLSSAAAFVGTLGSTYLHPLADPIAGGLVSLWIFRAAYTAWSENLHYLTGGGASPELREQIVAVAASIAGVENVHQVVTEYIGPRLVVDVHLNVNGTMSLFHAHEIADEVQAQLEALRDIDRAYIHLEPCEEVAAEKSGAGNPS